MKLSEELQVRGFIHQYAGTSVAEVVDGPKRIIYHGIDPTADSAHAGNFVAWLLLRHLSLHGHTIIFLVGGGTGMIGDPKPDVERPLLSTEVIEHNVAALQRQAKQIFGDAEVQFVNNADWLTNVKLIEFLREIGKHFTVNELIKKDAISSRLKREDGISYTEFAYPLLQGYDYLELYRRYGCDVQVGGSDQWGNIVAGVDLIRRKEKKKVFALTTPMITDKATGKKFGKSEGNAVWLDPKKTSPYTFYQFWVNTNDESAPDYLKIFTFLPLTTIDTIIQQHQEDPGARLAQRTLAYEVTKLVHGESAADNAQAAASALFGEVPFAELSSTVKQILEENAPTIKTLSGTSLVDVLVEASLASSKREARTFIESGAVQINNAKIEKVDSVLDKDQFGDALLLKRGKKHMVIVKLS